MLPLAPENRQISAQLGLVRDEDEDALERHPVRLQQLERRRLELLRPVVGRDDDAPGLVGLARDLRDITLDYLLLCCV